GVRGRLRALAGVGGADAGACFTGRRFGGKLFKGRKLAPRISPNKTVEGLAGGMLAAVAAGIGFSLIAGAGVAQLPAVALVSLAAGLLSVGGDPVESLVKRHTGVKALGHLIPGNGGLHDPLDVLPAQL